MTLEEYIKSLKVGDVIQLHYGDYALTRSATVRKITPTGQIKAQCNKFDHNVYVIRNNGCVVSDSIQVFNPCSDADQHNRNVTKRASDIVLQMDKIQTKFNVLKSDLISVRYCHRLVAQDKDDLIKDLQGLIKLLDLSDFDKLRFRIERK